MEPEPIAASNVRTRTLGGYRAIVERHFVPNLRSIPLTDLRPQHLQAYYTDRLSHGRLDGRGEALSPRSVLHHHRVLFEALGHATVSITLDTYSHVTPGLQQAAAKSFEKSLVVEKAAVAGG